MDTELAYLAGFFDGEGCISISKRSRTAHGYGLMVSVSQLNPEPLLVLRKRFGGSISRSKDKRGFRTLVVWTIGARLALAALEEMRPYLSVKADEADVALEFQRGIDTWTDKAAETERRALLSEKLQEMKQRTYDHIVIPPVEHAKRTSSPRRLEPVGTRPSKPKPPKKVRVKRVPVKSTGYDRSKKPDETMLADLYRECGPNATARYFGVSRQTIYNWLDGYGISRNGRTPESEARRRDAVGASWTVEKAYEGRR